MGQQLIADRSHSCSAATLRSPALSLHTILRLGCPLESSGEIKKILLLNQHPRFVKSESEWMGNLARINCQSAPVIPMHSHRRGGERPRQSLIRRADAVGRGGGRFRFYPRLNHTGSVCPQEPDEPTVLCRQPSAVWHGPWIGSGNILLWLHPRRLCQRVRRRTAAFLSFPHLPGTVPCTASANSCSL